MWLFLAFLAIPLIEIALFIQVGGAIGLGWTLLIVIATAVLGATMVRSQGAMALGQVQQSFSEIRDPTEPLAHGAMILFAGALLLTPGFFTDAVGFSLLIPQVRAAVFAFLKKRVKVHSFSTTGSTQRANMRPSDVIDGEFEEVEQTHRPSSGPSGWTKH